MPAISDVNTNDQKLAKVIFESKATDLGDYACMVEDNTSANPDTINFKSLATCAPASTSTLTLNLSLVDPKLASRKYTITFSFEIILACTDVTYAKYVLVNPSETELVISKVDARSSIVTTSKATMTAMFKGVDKH